MTKQTNNPSAHSVFHAGEIAIQERLGIAEQMAEFGRMMVRVHMPRQHQDFYQQLPYIFMGSNDSNGHVWASILASEPGFISTQDSKRMSIKANPLIGDPLNDVLANANSSAKPRLGLLGIDLSNRRRNRLSGQLDRYHNGQIELDILQAFGNCPQYIQTRKLHPLTQKGHAKASTTQIAHFDRRTKSLIAKSDSFFVASSNLGQSTGHCEPESGTDISYRGGQPGFIRIDNDSTLTIPDFSGNNHFNTLGNIEVNPNVGLLFIDFNNGHVLTLTGTAKILWHSRETAYFNGAKRLWQFSLKHGFLLENALPWRWKFDAYSPYTKMTDTWLASNQRIEAQKLAQKTRWHSVHIERIEQESQNIKSFYLQWPNGDIPKFNAGQFITLNVELDGKNYLRNYTISSAPSDPFFRVSIKRETSRNGLSPDGRVSTYLHTKLKVGDKIEVSKPAGQFSLEPENARPVVFLTAGIGITPALSMFRQLLNTGAQRQAIFITSFRNGSQQAFAKELSDLVQNSVGSAKVAQLLSKPSSSDEASPNKYLVGRMDKAKLQTLLPIDHYQFYLCGPAQFMQDSYDMLLQLGVDDADIKAESFGPATLKRQSKTLTREQKLAETADNAVVQFAQSQVEQGWSKEDGNLLEFAENHGIEPIFGCRTGQCGACAVKITEGKVSHSANATALHATDEVLLCCAKPARSENGEISRLALAL